MKSKETSSVNEVNRLIKEGWRIYKTEKKEGKIIFWLIKD